MQEEMKMKPHSCDTNILVPSTQAMHKDSHVISKLIKPKIRIVHIFAPEIIKTDAANFRELVQRLTGKPADRKGGRKKTTSTVPSKELTTFRPAESSNTIELQDGTRSMQNEERIKEEEEEIWRGEEYSNGFLGGFADLDGFIQELSDFPLLPLKSSHMDVFGQMPLC